MAEPHQSTVIVDTGGDKYLTYHCVDPFEEVRDRWQTALHQPGSKHHRHLGVTDIYGCPAVILASRVIVVQGRPEARTP